MKRDNYGLSDNYGLTNPDGVISTVVVLLVNELRALC
jgi:hypothetical protein